MSRTARPLEVAVVPIYIQEKIDPGVLIENLRPPKRPLISRTSSEQLTFLLRQRSTASSELDQEVDFYKHDANWSNRMIIGDSLQVMASSRQKAREAPRQGPDGLHRPALRHQVRLELAGICP